MIYMISLAALILAAYFCIRLFLLKNSLRQAEKELEEICRDLSENRILCLPAPDRDLEKLLGSVDRLLEGVRAERIQYARREKEFQSQIEAVSHDLRTPLTVILGYLRFFRDADGAALAEEQSELIDVIEKKARSMENLTAQFYEYSRLRSDDLELELEPVDVGRILREIFAENCFRLEESRLQVQADLSDRPFCISGQKDALERIFTNLFQNASRYGESFLRISVTEKEHCAEIIFANDTRGIKERDIPHLFDRFYMSDRSRGRGGTGLGLTIAKGLTEKMGGTMSAHYEDHTLSLSIRFPLIRSLSASSLPRRI